MNDIYIYIYGGLTDAGRRRSDTRLLPVTESGGGAALSLTCSLWAQTSRLGEETQEMGGWMEAEEKALAMASHFSCS